MGMLVYVFVYVSLYVLYMCRPLCVYEVRVESRSLCSGLNVYVLFWKREYGYACLCVCICVYVLLYALYMCRLLCLYEDEHSCLSMLKCT